ncbi:2OG-FeII_Oxy domain-containing protein/DIOX_N domain-containing protein [Cephalotus follicularis]|uniref:2OG-FeII_Oxy domain-containing protein/DIOX_N domain-containing protein n=1 Tax=Cephalotus follicularis TaxID=3775 RepID=A0A1Q3CPQ7_CEPFO|nr:2OG-FeII_Oxy domain-containing protein/DIOX_N domain-containing protein [Cephalotus follicularis]
MTLTSIPSKSLSLLYKTSLVSQTLLNPSPSPSNQIISRRITCHQMSSVPSLRTVTISYSDLKDKNTDLSARIEEGFGPHGLGILSISDVPGYPSLRRNLLSLSTRLASLPEEAKKELEDPRSRYNFGWSHGKEKLESGKLDMLKGSYYANPILDLPTSEKQLIERYPSYCGSNIWPRSALPELEVAFKALGKLILDVGLMVAYHCDRYVSKGMNMDKNRGLEQILLSSRCHKGRLLYYFPAQQSNGVHDDDSISSWCGWHTDHGSLTGLTCGMFKREGVEIPCPDNAAGLYIRTRTDQIVKVVFEENDIAYQIGETTEILSRGYLCATPHCVRAPTGEEASGVERSTFALFMQPDWDQKLNFPDEVHIHKELISSNAALTFGEYSEKLLDKYYHMKS